MFKKTRRVTELVDQHFDTVLACFNAYYEFIGDYVHNADLSRVQQEWYQINQLEKKADDYRYEIFNQFMTESTFMGQTRKEILEMVSDVDKIANRVQNIARQILYEQVIFKEEIKEGIIEICKITQKQMEVLEYMLELLFLDHNRLIKDKTFFCRISTYEEQIDEIELECIQSIFNQSYSLTEKIYMKHFIEKMADISDHIENISDDIQGIIAYRKV